MCQFHTPPRIGVHSITGNRCRGINVAGIAMPAQHRSLLVSAVESGCTAPSTLPGVAGAVGVSKLQAPTAGDNTEELEGFCNEYFTAQARPSLPTHSLAAHMPQGSRAEGAASNTGAIGGLMPSERCFRAAETEHCRKA